MSSTPAPGPRPTSSQAWRPGGPRRRRIGLFGGSFDPVHAGHLHAAHAALAAFDLDRVVFVPAAAPPHKPGRELASGHDRLAMLALALAGEPRFAASDLELARGGTSYTIDTVRALPDALGEARDVEVYMILGSDNLRGLERWREVEELLARVQPVVVERASADWNAAGDSELDAIRARLRASLTPAAWEKLERGRLRLPPLPASSSALRERMGSDAVAPQELAAPVLAYIRARGLYGSRA